MTETPNNNPIDPEAGDDPFDPRERAMHGLLLTYYELETDRSCPPLSELWRHVEDPRGVAWSSRRAGTHARADLESHLQSCPRCQNRLQLLRRELRETLWPPRNRSIRFFIPYITAGLAIAACLTALFIFYEEPRGFSPRGLSLASGPDASSGNIALVFDAVQRMEQADLRGEQGRGATGSSSASATAIAVDACPQWLQQLLADREALEILAQRSRYEFTLQSAYTTGQIELHDHRPQLAPHVDAGSERGQSLIRALTQDHEICDQIVNVLLRHLPNAPETNRADLRMALDQWRADNVFGK